MIGYQELIIIFLIVLLLFGGSKIPELARGLGKGIREFKKAKDGLEDEIKKEISKGEKLEGDKPRHSGQSPRILCSKCNAETHGTKFCSDCGEKIPVPTIENMV